MRQLGVRPDYLPSGYVKIAIEHGPVEIVDLPIFHIVIFQFAMLVITRGYTLNGWETSATLW